MKNDPATAAAPRRSGFTLIEVLMVISIIGILVAILIPAVYVGLRTVKQGAISMECQSIANAVEQYKNKYGEYPPDGSDQSLLVRHLRKIFPQISASEINLLNGTLAVPAGNPIVAGNTLGSPASLMEPSEALVFFLGGFSDDPIYPFTGEGGPLYVTNAGAQVRSDAATITHVQYNIDRDNWFHEFNESQLSLQVQTVNGSDITSSSDDADLMPHYHPAGLDMPYVYFESRSYQQGAVYNRYETSGGANGYVYPYRSAEVNTKVDKSNTAVANRTNYFRFMNPKSFQLISAGLDDHFGGGSGIFYIYKPVGSDSGTDANSGESLTLTAAIASGTHPASPTYSRFTGPSDSLEQLDNVANFADGILGDSLDN